MDDQGPGMSFNTSEERTLNRHLFDETAMKKARPAVPLERALGGRKWPLVLIVSIALAALAGGVVGGVTSLVFHRYETAREPTSAPAQNTASAENSGPSEHPASSQVALNTPAEEPPTTPQNPDARKDARNASDKRGPNNASGNTDLDQAVQSKRPKESGLNEGELSRSSALAPLPDDPSPAKADSDTSGPPAAARAADAQAELRSALSEWVAATNARDINKQMSFYNPTVNTFYLTRNVSRDAVRAEKARVFGQANVVEVRAGASRINLAPDGRTALMRFHKRYSIEGSGVGRHGEVVQELRWQRTAGGWKIVGERDIKVVH